MKIRLFIILLLPFASYSQDRIDSEVPLIQDTIASIKYAKGWMKNEIGKWVSLPNAIPSKDNRFSFPCYEFVEYSLLKISFKNDFYYCLLHKKKGEVKFYVINYFIPRQLVPVDTLIHSSLNVVQDGYIFGGNRLKEALINEMFKKFENPDSYNSIDNITIDLSINKPKNILRFFIDDGDTILCGKEENALEVKYFESSLNNLKFFEALLPE